MKTIVIALVLFGSVVPAAFALPGDPRIVAGTLAWPPILQGELFAVVRGHDGRFYYADFSRLSLRDMPAVRAGERIVLKGAEGLRPHEIVTTVIGPESAALLRPDSDTSVQPAASPPTLESSPIA